MSRPVGTFEELERRRRLAVRRVAEGEAPTTVARILDIPLSTLYRWRQAAQQGEQALAAKPPAGPTPKLSDPQLQQLQRLLLQGATAHGWPNDLWTGKRVAELIRRHFDVQLHPDHVVRMLRQRLGWSSQRPQRRARERNDKEVERWKADEFPRVVREAYARRAHLVFFDVSGFQLTPLVRRSLAPIGHTPIFKCCDRRNRISVLSAITLSPVRAKVGLMFRLLWPKTNATAQHIVEFLREVKRSLPGAVTVLWDGSPIHSRAKVVQAYLAKHPDLVAETLPAYAPELNPDELVWSWSKYGRLANWAPADVEELWDGVFSELYELRDQPELLTSFINHVDLPLTL